MSRRLRDLLLFALLAGLPLGAAALTSDRQQPIHIQADQVELDAKRGVGTYRGDVVVEQGTLRLQAQELRVFRKAGQLDRIVATGAPVSFRQRPENAEHDVEGSARRLEYRHGAQTIHLRGDARVRQFGDEFSGEYIVYDTQASTVRAESGTEGDGRVHAIIQPREDTEQ